MSYAGLYFQRCLQFYLSKLNIYFWTNNLPNKNVQVFFEILWNFCETCLKHVSNFFATFYQWYFRSQINFGSSSSSLQKQ
jgi:hypothetical protein